MHKITKLIYVQAYTESDREREREKERERSEQVNDNKTTTWNQF